MERFFYTLSPPLPIPTGVSRVWRILPPARALLGQVAMWPVGTPNGQPLVLAVLEAVNPDLSCWGLETRDYKPLPLAGLMLRMDTMVCKCCFADRSSHQCVRRK